MSLEFSFPKQLMFETCSGLSVTDVASNGNWKTCLWKRESDSNFCMMDYQCKKNCNGVIGTTEWEVTMKCSQELKNATYFGSDPNKESHICGIVVPNAGPEESTKWTCDVSVTFVINR